MTLELRLRPATTGDVHAIKALVGPLAQEGVLVIKETVAYYEGIQEFLIAELVDDDPSGAGLVDESGIAYGQPSPSGAWARIVGCGALHVMWQDLAEIRTLAADPRVRGQGVGWRLVEALLERARRLGVDRVFCLTFEVEFFQRQGFRVMADQRPIDPDVFAELLRSHDEGVAEFLDLARVKPNTLGNTRMILTL